MEPRSILASYDPSEDRYTIWTPSQNPHSLRFWLANDSLFVPEHKLRVVAPDFGGSFGQRSYHYPEDASLLGASKLPGRPGRWNSTRPENLRVESQCRGHSTRSPLASGTVGAGTT